MLYPLSYEGAFCAFVLVRRLIRAFRTLPGFIS